MMLVRLRVLIVMMVLLASAAQASAQTGGAVAPTERWRIDVGLGLDLSLSGNINSGTIGVLNDQVVVTTPNGYEDVYGSGVHFRFGGGYAIDDVSELRAVFSYQSLDADLTRLGELGASPLYGQYDDYKSLTLDVGYRRYAPTDLIEGQNFRLYAEGTIGLGFVSEIDVLLAAPASGQVFDATDFYDGTAAFSMGLHAGVLFPISEQLDLNLQLGFRYLSGLSEVDAFAGTGLSELNRGSRRWTMPIIIGTSFRF